MEPAPASPGRTPAWPRAELRARLEGVDAQLVHALDPVSLPARWSGPGGPRARSQSRLPGPVPSGGLDSLSPGGEPLESRSRTSSRLSSSSPGSAAGERRLTAAQQIGLGPVSRAGAVGPIWRVRRVPHARAAAAGRRARRRARARGGGDGSA
jgi:hypothetical protein